MQNFGEAFYRLKQYDSSFKYYSKVTRLNLDFAYGYLNNGKALLELKEYNSAEANFKKAFSLKGVDGLAYYWLCCKDIKQ